MTPIDKDTAKVPAWIRQPIAQAVILVAAASLVGLGLAFASSDAELKKALITAVITLIFSALIGGVLKILFDNYTLNRQQREANVTFVTNVLSDLKAAYDSVAAARFQIAAHKSAQTYGEEMLGLTKSSVQLHNVVRALNTRPGTLVEARRRAIAGHVDQMRAYLDALTDEFQGAYRGISESQRVYEAEVAALDKGTDPRQAVTTTIAKENELWNNRVACLPCLQAFIAPAEGSEYCTCFVVPLNEATCYLRAEAARIASGKGADTTIDSQVTSVPDCAKGRAAA